MLQAIPMKQSGRFQLLFSFSLFFFISGCGNAQSDPSGQVIVKNTEKKVVKPEPKPVLDSVAFKKKMIAMAMATVQQGGHSRSIIQSLAPFFR